MPTPTCTLTGCNLQTPILDVVTCAPDGVDGEITALYISDAVPADNTAFDNPDNTVAGGMKKLLVTGQLNAPEQGSIEAEGGVTLLSKNKTRSASGQFYNLSDANYSAIRQLQCGKPVLVWIELGGQYIIGGDANLLDGISTVINVAVQSDGAGSFARAEWSFSWKAIYEGERLELT